MNSFQQLFKTVGLVALLLVSFSLVQAQAPEQERGERQGRRGARNIEPADMAERQTKRMTEDLALSEAQIPEVEAVNLKYAEMMKAGFEANQDDRQAMAGLMTDIRAKRMKAMKAVLTKEQYKAFKKAEMERQESRQNRGPRGGGGQGGPGGPGGRGGE
ncbi:MAG: hypothetical protein AAFN10_25175 [Bacteroidota bacterium]